MNLKRFSAAAAVLLTISLAAGEAYNFYFISDPHLGDEKSYNTAKTKENPFKTKKNTARADQNMATFDAMLKDIAAKKDSSSKFIISGGDLIEGGCTSEKVHEEQLSKYLNKVQKAVALPLFPVNGNHDDWGLGGPQAFKAVAWPFIRKQTGKPLASTKAAHYVVHQDNDVFIFADYHTVGSGWTDFVLKELKAIKGTPRYVFVIVHCNIIPFPGKGNAAIRDELAKFNGFILCGHSHQNQVYVYGKDGKTVTQVTVGTCFSRPGAIKANRDQQKYFNWFIGHYCKNPAKAEEVRREYIPYTKDFVTFGGAAYARFDVSDNGVELSYQASDLTQPPQKVKLR